MDTTLAPILVTLSGPDGPGITSKVTQILCDHDVDLLDIEQVVVRGHLTLCVLVGAKRSLLQTDPVFKELLFAGHHQGLEVSFRTLPMASGEEKLPAPQKYVVTAMGKPLTSIAVSELSTILYGHGVNIDSIRRLSHDELASVEFVVSLSPSSDLGKIRSELMRNAHERLFDVALQKEQFARRAKRLIAMDMDSTLTPLEVIDELAKLHGVFDEVSTITARAMHGELDYTESLVRRVALLKGLPLARVEQFAKEIPLTKGAERLVQTAKALGFRVGVISGGFSFAVQEVTNRLALDFSFANELEHHEGVFSGKLLGPIINAEKKAECLRETAARFGIPLEQTVAIGDGANDVKMLATAGLGIAFHAKAHVIERTETNVNFGDLENILYLIGLDQREFVSSTREVQNAAN